MCFVHGRGRNNARIDWNRTVRSSRTRDRVCANKPIQTRTSKQNPRRLR